MNNTAAVLKEKLKKFYCPLFIFITNDNLKLNRQLSSVNSTTKHISVRREIKCEQVWRCAQIRSRRTRSCFTSEMDRWKVKLGPNPN